jgi:hypothetical protein
VFRERIPGGAGPVVLGDAGVTPKYLIPCSSTRPCSGAVIGLAMPLPEGDIYGPALERAVHLEGTVSGYPRIAVGGELMKYIEALASLEPQTQFGRVAMEAAQSCQRMIFRDSDDQLALDFLGEECRQYHHDPTLVEILPKAFRFVRAEQEHWRGHQDEKLAQRYDMLWAYMRSRAKIWGPEIEKLAADLDQSSQSG